MSDGSSLGKNESGELTLTPVGLSAASALIYSKMRVCLLPRNLGVAIVFHAGFSC